MAASLDILISAKDQASPVIDGVQQKIVNLGTSSPEFLTRLDAAAEKLQLKFTELKTATGDLSTSFSSIRDVALNLSEGLQQKLSAVSSSTSGVVQSLDKMSGKIEEGLSGAKKAADDLIVSLHGAQKATSEAGSAQQSATSTSLSGIDAFLKMDQTTSVLKERFLALKGATRELADSLINVKTAVAAAIMGFATGSLVSTANQFDKFEASLKTVTGSSAKAKEAFAWIKDFAATTPYELGEVTQAFISLATRGFDARKVLGEIGRASCRERV